MKKIYFILITLLFSCCTTANLKPEAQDIKIWEIDSYIIDNEEFMNDEIEKAFVTYNTTTQRTHIHYLLSKDTTTYLEYLWEKNEKKLKLDKVYIVHEVTYKLEENKLEITSVKRDFVIKGKNTDNIQADINNIEYTERKGESTGLIPLLLRTVNPNVVDNIPYPELKKGEIFFIETIDEVIELTHDNKTIKSNFTGVHRWIGY